MKNKKKPIQVVYNINPDPVTKITEYSYTGEGLKLEKVTTKKYKPTKDLEITINLNKDAV